jgi:hypothetical protein
MRAMTAARGGWDSASASQSPPYRKALTVEAQKGFLEAVVHRLLGSFALGVALWTALILDGPCQSVPSADAGVPGVQIEGDHVAGPGLGHVAGDARQVAGRLGIGVNRHLSLAVGDEPSVLLRVVRPRQEPQRATFGDEVVEVNGELHPAHADAVVVVPAGLGEVEDAFWATWDDWPVQQILRDID